jgi:hypothetical protein
VLCWIILSLNIYFVARLVCLLRKELQDDEELINRYTSKLKWYPLIQIISLLPATISRLYYLATRDNNFYLVLIQCIFDSLTGLMFSLVYGFNPSVRAALVELCRKFAGTYRTRTESSGSTKGKSRDLTLYEESFINNNSDINNPDKSRITNQSVNL